MPSGLTNDAEVRVIDWTTGNATTAPTTPLRVRLMSTEGDDTTAGTENSDAIRVDVTFGVAVAGAPSSADNDSLLRFDGFTATDTINGIEVWDSAATPFRWGSGPLVDQAGNPTSATVGPSQPLELPAGDVVRTLGG